jgi:predicted permease
VGQVGVGMPNYAICALIALWFGTQSSNINLVQVFKTFFLNPPVVSFIAGLLWALLSLPHTGFLLTIVFGALQFSGISLTFLAALLTGLTMKKIGRKDLGLPFFTCAALLLLVQPVIAYELDAVTGSTNSMASVLVLLLGAMPASPLVIAYSVRYGCDVDLAAKLVISTCALSMFTLPLLAYLYF